MRSRLLHLIPAIVISSAGVAFAQTGYTITGGMGNFDIHNHCDHEVNECEIEIEGIHPEDVYHCYHNGNYGNPSVTLRGDGLATIIDYRNPTHPTSIGSIEHFGISLRTAAPGNIRVRWMRNGLPATVNGQVPGTLPNGASSTTHSVQPTLPLITAEPGTSFGGGDSVICTVTNTDPHESIWIKRRASVTTGPVTLEALMPNDPVVTTSLVIDSAAFRLDPGQSIAYTNDLLEAEENQNVVFAAEYWQDIVTVSSGGGPFGGGPVTTHTTGVALGNLMTATANNAMGPCEWYKPVIVEQPVSVELALGMTANVRVNADGNDMDLHYQWQRDGVDLVESAMFQAVDTDELSIEEVTPASQGFYSCRIWNDCGEIITQSALVFVIGTNDAPPRPATCPPDLGGQGGTTGADGTLDNNDFVVFIGLFFDEEPGADLGGQGGEAGEDGAFDNNDFVVFINDFFDGCQ